MKARNEGMLSQAYLPIEDYGMIGDLHTVALVGNDGSIDWCCLPRFDAPSVFGALLDVHKGGFFHLSPAGVSEVQSRQLYVPETNILITRFLSPDGIAEVTDFMQLQPGGPSEMQQMVVRSVKVIRGSLPFEMVCRPAFNFARDPHAVQKVEQGFIFRSTSLHLGLAATVPLEDDGQQGVRASFVLYAGQSARFLLVSGGEAGQALSHLPAFGDHMYYRLLDETLHYWRHWLSQCRYQGRWREMVQRSALALKLLTYAPTGALVAAPTTSLPETIGGWQNWDYRYTWLRDASYTIYSLLVLGFTGEAEHFMHWLDARCHEEEGGSLQPVYSIEGRHDLQEDELEHLEGYRESRPVRVGNAAYRREELDIYGALMDAVYLSNREAPISYDLWSRLHQLLEWLRGHWDEPDAGIWERRTGPKRFVHSRVMSWVAFDRALRLARQRGLPAPLSTWEATSATIYEQIMREGWSERKRSFVQAYGEEVIDASALLMIPTKFASQTEPRILQTIERIRKQLTADVLVRRDDGGHGGGNALDNDTGTFSPASFWLAENLARAGYLNEARLHLEKMLSYCNHVGLYPESIGKTGEALGNYPHAFTHLSLITACYHIDRLLDKAETGGRHNRGER